MDYLKQLTDRVWYTPPVQATDQPVLAAVLGDRRTLMLDAGGTARGAASFLDGLRLQTGREVDAVALTHWHWDHVFGLSGLTVPAIARRETATHLRRLAGYGWSDEELDDRLRRGEEIPFCAAHIRVVYPTGAERAAIRIHQPEVVFDGSLTLDLGGVVCELLPLPAVHGDDNVALLVRGEGVLFLGDAMGCDCYHRPPRYDAAAVLELFRLIRGWNPSVIVESHGLPATLGEFWAENGVLELGARAVLEGVGDHATLADRLRRELAEQPDDLDEVVDLFLAGVERR